MNFPVKYTAIYIFLVIFALPANAQSVLKEKSTSSKPARTGVMKKISVAADEKRKEEKSVMVKSEESMPVKKETKPAPKAGGKATMKKEPKKTSAAEKKQGQNLPQKAGSKASGKK